MSLVEAAFRIATVRALRGKTFVDDAVFDQPVDPMNGVFVDGFDFKRRPAIAVYTNIASSKIMGNDVLASENKVELTLQFYVPYEMKIGEVKVSGRDAAGRLIQDLLARQVQRVFLHDASPWAEVWRSLKFQNESVKAVSFILATDNKFEVAGREVAYTFELCAEPDFSGEAEGGLADFLELAEEDDELAPIVPLLAAEIAKPAGSKDWQNIMAQLGSSSAAVKGIGLTTALLDRPEDAPGLVEVTVVDEDGGAPLVVVPDE